MLDPIHLAIVEGDLLGCERERLGCLQQHAEIGLADRSEIEAFRHLEIPRRAQGIEQQVIIEQPARLQLGAPHLVIGITDRRAADADEILQFPAERHDAQNAIFERKLAGIGLQLGDARIDAGDITARALHHLGRQGPELGGYVAAEVEQAYGAIGGQEARPQRLGHAAQFAAMAQIDLEQSVARDDIALAEEGVMLGLGTDMRDAALLLQDLDRCAQALQAHRAAALDHGLRPSDALHGDERGRCQEECAALDHQKSPKANIM